MRHLSAIDLISFILLLCIIRCSNARGESCVSSSKGRGFVHNFQLNQEDMTQSTATRVINDQTQDNGHYEVTSKKEKEVRQIVATNRRINDSKKYQKRKNGIIIASTATSSVRAKKSGTKAASGSGGGGGIFSTKDRNNNTVLTYYGLMLSGAVARSAAATAVHPLNVIKTLLQTKDGKVPELKWSVLSRGAGSQFIMSVPHGAFQFVVTETTKNTLAKQVAANATWIKPIALVIPKQFVNPFLDFCSSAISTFICSVISTPQMVLTDRIMAGVYPNFFVAVVMVAKNEGIRGYYKGWFPALAQKIPSYALTWMFFQQFKNMFFAFMRRSGTTIENMLIGSLAAAGACCVMIPIDTVKTRIVMQPPGVVLYSGMWDCIQQLIAHEGIIAFYRALPPRLMAVVPMIGIQFGVYELMKRLLLGLPPPVIFKGASSQKKDKPTATATSSSSTTTTTTTTTAAAAAAAASKEEKRSKTK